MSVSAEDETATASVSPLIKGQLRKAQISDPVICTVLDCKLSVRELKAFSPKTVQRWDKLTMVNDGFLYRATTTCVRLVLPEQHKDKVLEELTPTWDTKAQTAQYL